ncbi:hypothetical protein [Aminobacter carboxidus]|uniref:Uncharacterized protein n=1 Tax=Aminobacter carboxidus TaxID=376165 RepID=A0A8E1WHH5_9HYPH|nr:MULTISPECIES: hypothetical protein [Aminobacter carboxidus group]MBB6467644.1 hypothetical protein [Aminobacter lissarensis]MBE1205863.1 hypothetical protein [Aminobacter carboxidus]
MTDSQSKAREQAESAFGKTQSQSLARNRINSEMDAVVQQREEKTLRLRALRLEKEAELAASAASAGAGKSARK